VAVSVLLAFVLVRAVTMPSRQLDAASPRALPRVDASRAAGNLGEAIRQPTVSIRQADDDAQQGGRPEAFIALHRVLAQRYPRVHATLDREIVADHSLLYRWRGSDDALAPLLLLGHLDVVPVEPGTEASWEQPPFSGAIADGFVWGRGALDDKAGVLGLLEAAEHLLADDFVPRRTILFAFGHDEEVSGTEGAAALAAKLEAEGTRPWMILDEGGIIVDQGIPGIDAPVAFVGVAEKGHASLALRVEAEGGHSSMPPPRSAIGRLAAAVDRVERRGLAASLDGATRLMIEHIAPEMSLGPRIALANLWLFGPVVRLVLASDPASDASIRTTTAPTMLQAGTADNVLASQAQAIVNFRIVPGQTVQDVIEHVTDVVDDPEVEVSCFESCWNPSPISPISRNDGDPWQALARTIRASFPGVVVAPHLVVGATDARHYQHLSPAIYRFLPIELQPSDRPRVHGTNERIAVDAFARAITFYMTLIVTTAA
jgi:carboxypeptidase PM20D1